jgi:hypothetical protein
MVAHVMPRPQISVFALAAIGIVACARQVAPPSPPKPLAPASAPASAPADAPMTAFTSLPFFPQLGIFSGCELTSGKVTCFTIESDSEETRISRRVVVEGLPPAVELRVGDAFACARTAAKTVYCWDSERPVDHDTLKATLIERLENVRALGMFRNGACAVTDSGEVACFEPGKPKDDVRSLRVAITPSSPMSPKTAELTGITTVQSGTKHACALDDRGRVWCWGDNELGQLGTGYGPSSSWMALEVPGIGRTKSLAVDFSYTCAAAVEGALHCWGSMAPPIFPGSDVVSYRPFRIRGGVRRIERWSVMGGSGFGEGPALWMDAGFFDGWDKKKLGAGIVDVSSSQTAHCARFENGETRCPQELNGEPTIAEGVSIAKAPQRLPSFPSSPFASVARVRGVSFALPVSMAPSQCAAPFDEKRTCPAFEQPSAPLDARQSATLASIMGDRASFGSNQEGWPLEARPDHAFIYYDASDKPVAWVAVDLRCQKAWAYPTVPAAIATGVSWGERTPLEPKTARRFAELCTSLGLARCPKASAIANDAPCPSGH